MSPWQDALARRARLLAFEARRLGLAGLVGAVLIVAALGARAGFEIAAERRADALRAEATRLRASLGEPAARSAPADRLAAFFDALDGADAPGAEPRQPTQVVHRIARRHGIKLERGDYQAVPDARGRVIRHDMTIPLEATYPELRAWLAEVLQTLPGAALTGLVLKRETADESTLEAQVRLAVYVKAPTVPADAAVAPRRDAGGAR